VTIISTTTNEERNPLQRMLFLALCIVRHSEKENTRQVSEGTLSSMQQVSTIFGGF